MSVEEYLEFERDSEVRHEYVGGELHAMTGASRRHNAIAVNILRKLADAAEGGPCRVYISDMKVLTPDGPFYYPDVVVACGEEPKDEYFEDGPCLLAEVVSPETEEIDRREKVAFYQRIPSLKAYLMVEENRPVVERLFRKEGGEWERAAHFQTGSHPIPCPEMRLSLAEIYEGF